jgi:protein-S-isoprenylcysteine O-methyltransferase Ste14
MGKLDLKVPPLAVVIVFAAAMWLVSVAAPAFRIALPFRHAIALALIAAGAAITVSGLIAFARARTTVNPLTPAAASALVESGIYRLTRNPMYLGFFIALVGLAVFLANLLAMLLLPGFVLYMNRYQIAPEEAALAARFGAAFSAYKAKVRRWL